MKLSKSQQRVLLSAGMGKVSAEKAGRQIRATRMTMYARFFRLIAYHHRKGNVDLNRLMP